MSAQRFDHSPTPDEFPADAFDLQPETIANDERTFMEVHAADARTVESRKRGSAFAAAFNAVMRRALAIHVRRLYHHRTASDAATATSR